MKKVFCLLGGLLIVFLICRQTGVLAFLSNVSAMRLWFSSLGWAGYVMFVLVSIFVAVFMLPGQFLAIIAGMTYGGFLGGILTVIGATIGASLSFLIGRYFLRDSVQQRYGQKPVFKKVEQGVKENGVQFLILTRLVPVFPFAIQSYAYAVTPISFWNFTFVSGITMLPASFVYAFLASEIMVNGFSWVLTLEFTILGGGLFLLTFIPKKIAQKRKIKLN